MAHQHPVYDTDTHFTIDPITRAIKGEAGQKTKLIQYDHNSECFSFTVPRYIEGHDMSQCTAIQVHYVNIDRRTNEKNADVYPVEDMQINVNCQSKFTQRRGTEEKEKLVWHMVYNITVGKECAFFVQMIEFPAEK